MCYGAEGLGLRPPTPGHLKHIQTIATETSPNGCIGGIRCFGVRASEVKFWRLRPRVWGHLVLSRVSQGAITHMVDTEVASAKTIAAIATDQAPETEERLDLNHAPWTTLSPISWNLPQQPCLKHATGDMPKNFASISAVRSGFESSTGKLRLL